MSRKKSVKTVESVKTVGVNVSGGIKAIEVEGVDSVVKKPVVEAPLTFPIEPEKHIGKCVHSNRKFIKGKAGFNCYDCGFFIHISSPDLKREDVVVHRAVINEPERIKLPKIADRYQIMELPRAAFDVKGEGFLKDEGFLGEDDKRKILIFDGYLRDGYRVVSLQQTQANSFLFLLEK